jgi:hypothetical protein
MNIYVNDLEELGELLSLSSHLHIGFSDSYQAEKRFVRKLPALQPKPIYRLECQP